MLHIPGSSGPILPISAVAGNVPQQLKSLVQIETLARSHVEDLSRHLPSRSFRRQQVGRDNIVNVGEITALGSIAEDGRLLAFQHQSDELRQHSRVGRTGVLPWAEDVEVAHAN